MVFAHRYSPRKIARCVRYKKPANTYFLYSYIYFDAYSFLYWIKNTYYLQSIQGKLLSLHIPTHSDLAVLITSPYLLFMFHFLQNLQENVISAVTSAQKNGIPLPRFGKDGFVFCSYLKQILLLHPTYKHKMINRRFSFLYSGTVGVLHIAIGLVQAIFIIILFLNLHWYIRLCFFVFV